MLASSPVRYAHVCAGEALTSVVCSPDGMRIAVAGYSSLVEVWDLQGRRLCTYRGHQDVVSSLTWSPDGHHLASGSWDGSIQVWDAQTGEREYSSYWHRRDSSSSRVLAVAWSPDGRSLASAATDWTIHVWCAHRGIPLQTLSDHLGGINCIAWAANSRHLLSAGEDATVRVWDALLFQRPLLAYRAHRTSLSAAAWSPDACSIVSLELGGPLHRWSLLPHLHTLWRQDLVARSQEELLPGAVAYAPDGACIATTATSSVVTLWNAQTGQVMRELHGHTDCVSSLAFRAGRFPDPVLITGSWDGSIIIWPL